MQDNNHSCANCCVASSEIKSKQVIIIRSSTGFTNTFQFKLFFICDIGCGRMYSGFFSANMCSHTYIKPSTVGSYRNVRCEHRKNHVHLFFKIKKNQKNNQKSVKNQ